MSVFKDLSKEFKVGALTTLAITILILGYNFMRGKDNPFTRGREYVVFYDSTQGLGIGTSVVFNGLRVGQLTSLDITPDGKSIQAIFELASSLEIPKDTKMKIESELLGGRKVRLVLGHSSEYAVDGDTLQALYASDQFSAINEKIMPLASKVDSLITTMNQFFNSAGLNQALVELPLAINSITRLLNESNKLIQNNANAVNQTLNNVSAFSTQLENYNKSIAVTLKNLEKFSNGFNEIDLPSTMRQLDSLSKGGNKIIAEINKGKGTVGKLIYDEQFYTALLQTTTQLNKVLLDLKKYPEKYIPVPATKTQRRKAKELSLKDTAIW
jgi:phospholipid/cholesterol/gamma-HCH transport system substrate-binding protein